MSLNNLILNVSLIDDNKTFDMYTPSFSTDSSGVDMRSDTDTYMAIPCQFYPQKSKLFEDIHSRKEQRMAHVLFCDCTVWNAMTLDCTITIDNINYNIIERENAFDYGFYKIVLLENISGLV
jgi:hypothetical protein